MAYWRQGAGVLAAMTVGLIAMEARISVAAPASRPAGTPIAQIVLLARGFAAASNPTVYARSRISVTRSDFEEAGTVEIALAGVFGEGSQLSFAPPSVSEGEALLELVPLAQVKMTLGELSAAFGDPKRLPALRSEPWHYLLPGPPAAPGHVSRVLVSLSGDPKLPTTRVQRVEITFERKQS